MKKHFLQPYRPEWDTLLEGAKSKGPLAMIRNTPCGNCGLPYGLHAFDAPFTEFICPRPICAGSLTQPHPDLEERLLYQLLELLLDTDTHRDELGLLLKEKLVRVAPPTAVAQLRFSVSNLSADVEHLVRTVWGGQVVLWNEQFFYISPGTGAREGALEAGYAICAQCGNQYELSHAEAHLFTPEEGNLCPTHRPRTHCAHKTLAAEVTTEFARNALGQVIVAQCHGTRYVLRIQYRQCAECGESVAVGETCEFN